MNCANFCFFNNKETQIGYGAQIEYMQNFNTIELQANYSYQHAETESGAVAGIYTPTHMLYLRGYKHIGSHFSSSFDLFWVCGIKITK